MSEYLWVEKYRPKTISECLLSEDIKKTFAEFLKQKEIPNLLLSGTQGTGKTTVARALCEELGADYIIINGSLKGNIDTLRNDIQQFASSVSFTGGRKYVILDEAYYLNPQSTQPALRNFMEEFSKNCGVVLTCNFKNRIIDPLHSRCSVIDFKIPKTSRAQMAAEFFARCKTILDQENVPYDQKTLAEVIKKHFPDSRRVLNELQRYSATGSIDTGILVNMSDENFGSLVKHMKDKSFTNVRKWVGENIDNEPTAVFRRFDDQASERMKPQSIPQLVLILADYQYKIAFVADHELNVVACMTEIMANVEFA